MGWQSQQTNWHKEDMFNPPLITRVKEVIYGLPGLLAQGPYINIWEDLLVGPPVLAKATTHHQFEGIPKSICLGECHEHPQRSQVLRPPMLLNATGEGVVILAFVNQAAVDIRRRLQKIDGLASKSIDALLEVANKVYNRGRPLKTD